MQNKFYIEHFSPKDLQKTNIMMDKYLEEVNKDRLLCKEEIKNVLKLPHFWKKLWAQVKTYRNR